MSHKLIHPNVVRTISISIHFKFEQIQHSNKNVTRSKHVFKCPISICPNLAKNRRKTDVKIFPGPRRSFCQFIYQNKNNKQICQTRQVRFCCRAIWQDLKDFMRKAGEVTFGDAHGEIGKNRGVVCFESKEEMERAADELDGREINGREVKLSTKIREEWDSGRDKSRSRSRGRRSPSRSRSRSPPPRRSRSGSRRRSNSRGRRSKSNRSDASDRKRSRSNSNRRSRSRSRSR
jgi:RNA recognition motif-containing protein